MQTSHGSSNGRRAATTALVSLALIVTYVGLAFWMVLVTPEDENPPRLLFVLSSVVLIVGMCVGVASAAFAILAVLRSGDRSKLAWFLAGIGVLGLLVVGIAIAGDIAGGTHGRDAIIRATFVDGHLVIDSVEYRRSASGPITSVTVRYTNAEAETQRAGLMQLTEARPGQFTASNYPMIDGRVQWFSYPGQDPVTFWMVDGVKSVVLAAGQEPPARPGDLSRDVAPGETFRFELSKTDFAAGTELVLFSDLPGRYESGQWVIVELR